MNQEQRKFLVEQVQKASALQAERIKKQMPDKPSLNNYLIAAFLDNSIQFADITTLRTKMRDTVLKFGISDKLVIEKDYYSSRKEHDYVQVEPTDLFVIPKAYTDALEAYNIRKAALDKELDDLNATTHTIIMKIQIGSSAAMDKLVMQIDSLGDLALLNTQLMISAGDNSKE